jgi:hypothetical protein
MSRVGTNPRTTSTSASKVEVLDPDDLSPQNARSINPESVNSDRQTGQNFSRAVNKNPSANTNHTNVNQESNEASGKNAFENMIGRGRTAVDKAGTTLMWGAGGLAGVLYLGLGWKKLAMVVGGLGVGAGYFLKTKLAKMGEEPDLDREVVNNIKAMKLPKELEKEIFDFLKQKLGQNAYPKYPEGTSVSP